MPEYSKSINSLNKKVQRNQTDRFTEEQCTLELGVVLLFSIPLTEGVAECLV